MRAAFDVMVALHVACAVVGFGSVAVSGVYGGIARHPDRPGAAEEAGRYFQGRGWAELSIALVPVFGATAVGLRPGHLGGFGQVWVIAGLAIWAVAAAVLFAVVRPAERDIRGLDVDRATAASGRLMWGSVGCDVLFVAALVFMVAQPV